MEIILTSLNNFCSEPGFSCVLSIIFIATSLPVGKCLANFTLAKLPLPMVLSNLYFPMVGSSPARLFRWADWDDLTVVVSELSFPL